MLRLALETIANLTVLDAASVFPLALPIWHESSQVYDATLLHPVATGLYSSLRAHPNLATTIAHHPILLTLCDAYFTLHLEAPTALDEDNDDNDDDEDHGEENDRPLPRPLTVLKSTDQQGVTYRNGRDIIDMVDGGVSEKGVDISEVGLLRPGPGGGGEATIEAAAESMAVWEAMQTPSVTHSTATYKWRSTNQITNTTDTQTKTKTSQDRPPPIGLDSLVLLLRLMLLRHGYLSEIMCAVLGDTTTTTTDEGTSTSQSGNHQDHEGTPSHDRIAWANAILTVCLEDVRDVNQDHVARERDLPSMGTLSSSSYSSSSSSQGDIPQPPVAASLMATLLAQTDVVSKKTKSKNNTNAKVLLYMQVMRDVLALLPLTSEYTDVVVGSRVLPTALDRLAAVGPPRPPRRERDETEDMGKRNQPESGLGSESSASKSSTPPQTAATTATLPPAPYRGYRGDWLAVVANSVHRRPAAARVVDNFPGGIELILSMCAMDGENPVGREWGLFAVRNLCEVRPEIQEYIRALKPVAPVQNEELARMGMQVELDRETGKLHVRRGEKRIG